MKTQQRRYVPLRFCGSVTRESDKPFSVAVETQGRPFPAKSSAALPNVNFTLTKPGLRFGSNRQAITLDDSEISEASPAGLLMPSSFVDRRGAAAFLQQSIFAEQLSAIVFSVERDAEGTR